MDGRGVHDRVTARPLTRPPLPLSTTSPNRPRSFRHANTTWTSSAPSAGHRFSGLASVHHHTKGARRRRRRRRVVCLLSCWPWTNTNARIVVQNLGPVDKTAFYNSVHNTCIMSPRSSALSLSALCEFRWCACSWDSITNRKRKTVVGGGGSVRIHLVVCWFYRVFVDVVIHSSGVINDLLYRYSTCYTNRARPLWVKNI